MAGNCLSDIVFFSTSYFKEIWGSPLASKIIDIENTGGMYARNTQCYFNAVRERRRGHGTRCDPLALSQQRHHEWLAAHRGEQPFLCSEVARRNSECLRDGSVYCADAGPPYLWLDAAGVLRRPESLAIRGDLRQSRQAGAEDEWHGPLARDGGDGEIGR